MIRQSHTPRRVGLLACSLAAALHGHAIAQRAEPDTLTSEERAIATRLAEEAVWPFRTEAPMYLVAIELVRPKTPEESRQAFVRHYRYDGDLAIQTMVDLARRQVVSLDTVPHLPLPFVAEEVEHARRLALADPRVRRALDPFLDELRVEAIPVRTVSPEDPLYRRRVLRLLFRVPRGYLEEPVVLVDLTGERVIIEQSRPPAPSRNDSAHP